MDSVFSALGIQHYSVIVGKIIGVGAQSTLGGGHDILDRKICMKN